jgi:hypothetical protein
MRKFTLVLLNLIILVSLVLVGCQLSDPFSLSSTPTNTPTFTPTPVCPTGIIPTPGGLKSNRRLIVVLFEDNPQYRPYALDGLKIFNKVLPNIIGPGDQLYMLRTEPIKLEDAVFVRMGIDDLAPPAIPPTPTLFPTITPTLPPIATPQTRINQLAATQDAISTVASDNATATQSSFTYNCAINSWGTQYSDIDKEWKETKNEAVQEFVQQVNEQEKTFEKQDPISRSGVWNGFALATTIFKNECSTQSKYDRCFLLVFSDMNDLTMSQPGELEINLKNTEILGILLGCEFLYTGECNRWREFWKTNLQAKSVGFINENIEQTIQAFLRR